MHKYKAVILVLASEDTFKVPENAKPLYPVFKQIFESYIDENPYIKVLFVYGGQVTFDPKPHDLVYTDIPETYHPGMICKTMRAIEHIHLNYNYDFLIRTNLSTFWHFDRLVKRLDQLPKESCLTGTPVDLSKSRDKRFMLNYVAGYDMVISRDIVEQLVINKDEVVKIPSLMNMEDQALCIAIKQYTGITHNSFGLTNQAFMGRFILKARGLPEEYDHVRCKLGASRNYDKFILNKLLKDTYNKEIELELNDPFVLKLIKGTSPRG